MDHIEGRSVSATTYKNHGCRCDGCRSAATLYQRKMRARGGMIKAHDRAQVRAHRLAAKWVRENYPEVWKECYAAALKEVLARGKFVPDRGAAGDVTPPPETV